MDELVCDGVLLSTAAGSTAYNLSAHGSILPLDSALLALTPISAFRPRLWKGALLSQKNSIEFKDALSSQWPRVKAWVKSMRLNYLFVKNSKETMLNHDKKYLKNNIQYVGNGVLERYFNYKALTFLGFMLRNRRRLLFKIMLQQLKEIILVS